MGWTWELNGGEAPDLPQPEAGFPSQAEAESWVGEVWRELLEEGIDSVTLFEDGRRVYGPMSLHAAE
jgi:hypothetical protein